MPSTRSVRRLSSTPSTAPNRPAGSRPTPPCGWERGSVPENHRDAEALRLTHVSDLDRRTPKEDASRVRTRRAGENTHKRRFARAILAN
jgi:hypothetical protein